jgi:hypothetical protein
VNTTFLKRLLLFQWPVLMRMADEKAVALPSGKCHFLPTLGVTISTASALRATARVYAGYLAGWNVKPAVDFIVDCIWRDRCFPKFFTRIVPQEQLLAFSLFKCSLRLRAFQFGALVCSTDIVCVFCTAVRSAVLWLSVGDAGLPKNELTRHQ